MRIQITKASGETEDINTDKLRASLVRSGAGDEQASIIIDRIIHEIPPLTSTKRIYRLARKYLRQINHYSGIRYSLKRALFQLGPTGYPFEKYYGFLLKSYGYETQTGVIIEGKCVKHEVDVIAVNDKEVSFVECKYHNKPGTTVDVKVAMYVDSRFRDLASVVAATYPGKKFRGWLVTNTRFTDDALQYAQCCKFDTRSWGYPGGHSLEKMIEDKGLYPVTIVSGIQSGIAARLLKENIILLKDLVEMSVGDIRHILSLPEKKAAALKEQADELCRC
jgi:Holliday junction resolvase-like predicted endonuclease